VRKVGRATLPSWTSKIMALAIVLLAGHQVVTSDVVRASRLVKNLPPAPGTHPLIVPLGTWISGSA